MRVYNLTQGDLVYRKKTIKPNGGFDEFPELDSGFIPDRDLRLEKQKVISFGKLPSWWARQSISKVDVPAQVAPYKVDVAPLAEWETPTIEESPTVEYSLKDRGEKHKGKR